MSVTKDPTELDTHEDQKNTAAEASSAEKQKVATLELADGSTVVGTEFEDLTTKQRYLAKPPTLKEVFTEPGLLNKAKLAGRYWSGSRLGRTMSRYGMQRGAMMSGGIAYSALFSIGAALTIAWTILMAFLGTNEELLNRVIKSVNQSMPGLLTTPEKEGLIDPASLVMDSSFSIASVIAIITLIFAATRVMANLRISIRAMFGIARYPVNFLIEKLRDILGFLILALGVLVTTVLGILVSKVGSLVLQYLQLDGPWGSFLLRLGSLSAAALTDATVFVLLITFVSGVHPPLKDLWIGGAIFGVLSGVLRYLGTSAVGSVADKPLLASFAALATLMLWVNLLARVTQMVAAFTANPPAPAAPASLEELHLDERPNYVTLTRPETLNWPHQTITGDVDADPEEDPNKPEPVSEPEPYWGGLIGFLKRQRIKSLERRLAKAKLKL
ncbi:YihY/virulence factor BrkB family protein [Boudabousia liubingyangii]|uniref:YihY/virulence factor BrkB family protein n=1 Tax=Boudabousia liubingyangii TaxID=1921764 RepID=UPI0015D66BB7|nr:YihY/virulence factor BrkB family protein [Boudabousia liubingyangii]